jgi:arabinogalactan endo-1,4-beta-galactosidase
MRFRLWWLFILLLCLVTVSISAAQAPETAFYRGVDLSYVNEMEDCGAVYQVDGEVRDPYQIFHDYGANLVRVRLWHTPDWTDYSTLEDVTRSLKRAEALGMDTLLDFHYSDTWADPSKQIIPAAWADLTDTEQLAQAVYDYTYDVLMHLNDEGVMPTLVQVGNEINTEILRGEGESGYPIRWERNAALINAGIRAVRDAGVEAEQAPRVVLHVAKPEEIEGWMLAGTRAGVTDFDIIGISYYPGWSMHSIETVGGIVNSLRYRFGKDVIIAETAYPWTFDAVSESAGNILDQEFLVDDYPATPEGQRDFLIDLQQTVLDNGGLGIVYWEPGWVSTECRTLWGQGSHWENATFFDFHSDNEVLPGIEFLSHEYAYPVDVTLRFQFADSAELPEQIFFRGDFTGMGRRLQPITLADGGYAVQARLMPGREIAFQFYSATPASDETALICTDDLASLVVPAEDTVIELSDDCA